MITAEQAAEMAGPKAEEYLAFIENKIIEAANAQKRQIIIRENPYCGWLFSSNKKSEEVERAIKILKENGFKLDLHYSESQFVDMGLKVEW